MGAERPAPCLAPLFLRFSLPCALFWRLGRPAPCVLRLDPASCALGALSYLIRALN